MDFIYSADRAMPDALCDELVACIDSHPGTHPGMAGAAVNPDKKLSTDLTLERFAELGPLRQRVLDVCLEHLADYFIRYPFVSSVTPTIMDNRTGVSRELTLDNVGEQPRGVVKMLIARLFRCGTINIQKYAAGRGGYPHWHSEISPEESFEALHRIVFWMYYLNDVAEGGETEFYFQQVKIRPRKGTVVIAPAGFTHAHRGNVPRSADKYIVTSWLLYNRGGQPRP